LERRFHAKDFVKLNAIFSFEKNTASEWFEVCIYCARSSALNTPGIDSEAAFFFRPAYAFAKCKSSTYGKFIAVKFSKLSKCLMPTCGM